MTNFLKTVIKIVSFNFAKSVRANLVYIFMSARVGFKPETVFIV